MFTKISVFLTLISAILGLLISFPACASSEDLHVQIEQLWDRAILEYDSGKYTEAKALLQQMLAVSRQAEELGHEARALSWLGNCSLLREGYDEAIQFWEESLEIYSALDDQPGMAILLSNLGCNYATLFHDYGKALNFLEPGYAISCQIRSQEQQADYLRCLAACYCGIGKLDKAWESADKALVIYEQLDDPAERAKWLVTLGGIYDATEQKTEAVDAFREALEIYRTLNEPVQEAFFYLVCGDNFLFCLRNFYRFADKYLCNAVSYLNL